MVELITKIRERLLQLPHFRNLDITRERENKMRKRLRKIIRNREREREREREIEIYVECLNQI